MDADHGEITQALRAYFDGFYEGDIDTLKTIFHPACHLYSAATGEVEDRPMDVVYAAVAGRISDAELGNPKEDAIITVDQSNPECAFAKVMVALGDKRFTDYLTLVKSEGEWRIITKTFSYVPRPDCKPWAPR